MTSSKPERQPTLPPDAAVHVRGWDPDDAEGARRFGSRVLALTQDYSRWLDLSRLSRIVLAFDFRAAVSQVPGIDGQPNVATSNEIGESAAMALLAMEEGVLKSVLVLWPPFIRRIFDEEDSPEKRTALQTYVHELVHVDDQAFLDKTFPGGAMAAVQRDDRHGALLLMVSPAQTEYSATSRTAMIEPSTGFEFLRLLDKTIATAAADLRCERDRYCAGSISLETFWSRVQERCRFIFQALGYAIGHADGVLKSDRADDALKEEYRAGLRKIEAMELGWLVAETRNALRPILGQTGWTGLHVFDPLIAVGERLLGTFGIVARLEDGKLHVDMP